MKGFHKVITFRMWNTYANVRAIADDIIESMNAHIISEDYAVTYSSTIKHSLLWSIGTVFEAVDDEEDEDESLGDMNKYSLWVIRIYQCDGNRGSRFASYRYKDKPINVDTKQQTANDGGNSFIQNYMEIHRLYSVLKFTMDKYNSMKVLSDERAVLGMRIECRDRIHKLIEYIEFLDKMYPIKMKQKEAEVNHVISHIARYINLIESDEYSETHTDTKGEDHEANLEG